MERKEILDLRIKNGAMMWNTCIDWHYQWMDYSDIEFDLWHQWWWSTYRMNIYQIIYSPNSNFFNVMFGDGVMTLAWIWQVQMKTSDYHKWKCVTSKDPLKYIRST